MRGGCIRRLGASLTNIYSTDEGPRSKHLGFVITNLALLPVLGVRLVGEQRKLLFFRLFLRMQNGSYGLRGDLKPSFLHSFSRSDVNKRPLTDGWQTYM